MLCSPLRADEQGAPRDKDLSRAALEVRRKDNRHAAGGPPIGAYGGRRREDVTVGQLGSPIAPSYVVPVRFLEEGDAARRMVVEESSLLVVKGGGMVEKPTGIPHQERGRRGGSCQSVRRNEVGDGGATAQSAPRGARGGISASENTPKG